ncbi:5-methylcytosine rRNA methyltransferase NSUN4-like [Gigantopelta aegis]|uniref:5-methylcytosine rRNA methyltransferase NSUN4-like n=1 Tax=Gigantopelta aegis TaxID=1735272 RepID=UPI001B88D73A|nr:5-methylcytosine rRNA methyltransferase NSUN4-like [Gigantopelta aegis]
MQTATLIKNSPLLYQRHIDKIIRRFRYKKKWALNLKEKTPSELALAHFDAFYRPVFGPLWPSIRISLLSLPKYCALVNNSATPSDSCKQLEKLGAFNILRSASQLPPRTSHGNKYEYLDAYIHPDPSAPRRFSDDHHEGYSSQPDVDEPFDLNPNTNLHEFMPVEKVYSSQELQTQEIVKQSVFEPRDIGVKVTSRKEITVPEQLMVYAFPKGNVSDFPAPKPNDCRLLGYYLLDAASILPVIALNLRPGDVVLDLCAAPGGKTLAILQTMLTDNITSNDLSGSRLKRLREILRWYCPERNVTLSQDDGFRFRKPDYNKVLVDVPCNTDRHVLNEEDNNLFKPSRTNERLEMTKKQKDLLVSGILSCRPGGSVVYSTCTLSPAQNDGIIQAACEEIWENTQIDIEVEDLAYFRQTFGRTFSFYDQCRYGQLVLPKLSSNFGPAYFCKINRLN